LEKKYLLAGVIFQDGRSHLTWSLVGCKQPLNLIVMVFTEARAPRPRMLHHAGAFAFCYSPPFSCAPYYSTFVRFFQALILWNPKVPAILFYRVNLEHFPLLLAFFWQHLPLLPFHIPSRSVHNNSMAVFTRITSFDQFGGREI
jgi:hypothetical protein